MEKVNTQATAEQVNAGVLFSKTGKGETNAACLRREPFKSRIFFLWVYLPNVKDISLLPSLYVLNEIWGNNGLHIWAKEITTVIEIRKYR